MSSDKFPLKSILGFSLIALGTSVVALVVLAAKQPEATNQKTAEMRQLARNIASGEGFTTNSISPLSLRISRTLESHPELYHAPGYPLVLAAAFHIGGASDRTTAVTGAGLWMLCVLVTVLFGMLYFGFWRGVVSALFLLGNLQLLKGAVLGFAHPLLALGMVLGVFIMASELREEAGEIRIEYRMLRFVGLGVVFAGLTLVHYLWLVFPVFGLLSVRFRKQIGWGEAAGMGTGWIAGMLPWFIRNILVTGVPYFSLYGYNLLSNTQFWPVNHQFHQFMMPTIAPWKYPFYHPVDLFQKWYEGLYVYWNELFSMLHPILLVGTLLILIEDWGKQTFRGIVVRGTFLTIFCFLILSAFFKPEPGLLACWAPLVSLVAADRILSWGTSGDDWPVLRNERYGFGVVNFVRCLAHYRPFLLSVLVGVVWFPIGFYLLVQEGPERRIKFEKGKQFQTQVPEEVPVLTNRPGFVSWYGDRTSVDIPETEEDFLRFQEAFDRRLASYIDKARLEGPDRQEDPWLYWLMSKRGVYRRFAPVEWPYSNEVIRVQQAE